ncbi:MAG: LuxR C-terminal-related transcriptional regulator [Bacteroidales bacterium]
MTRRNYIIIAEPSAIIRSGLISILSKLQSMNLEIEQIPDLNKLKSELKIRVPDILIVNPAHLGYFSLQTIKADVHDNNMKVIALQQSLADNFILSNYDDQINLYDTIPSIQNKLSALLKIEKGGCCRDDLTGREKEVLVCVVKGMINKQIADKLFVSVNTIMTHRKNITNKLEIHSTAGLTIFAIVHKLIDINDVKNVVY